MRLSHIPPLPLWGLLGPILLLCFPAPVTASCRPVNIMLVVDTSNSMNQDGKILTLQSSMNTIVRQFQSNIRFGLIRFSGKEATLEVPLGPIDPTDANARKAHTDTLLTHIAQLKAGGETPLTSSLSTARFQFSAQLFTFPAHKHTDEGSKTRSFILLVTDGHNSDFNGDPLVEVVKLRHLEVDLKTYDVRTYVLGLGAQAAINDQQLNAIANLGGTKGYLLISDLSTFTQALQTISRQVSAESCNGYDDDCDGVVDEELQQTCQNRCHKGSTICQQGGWSPCNAPPVKPEVCDGIDNDCNGQIDEGSLCVGGLCVSNAGKTACQDACTQVPCPQGSVCHPQTERCIPQVNREFGTCHRDKDCPGSGQRCLDGQCTKRRIVGQGCNCNTSPGSPSPFPLLLVLCLLFTRRLRQARAGKLTLRRVRAKS